MSQNSRRPWFVGALLLSVLLSYLYTGVEWTTLVDGDGLRSFGDILSGLGDPDLSANRMATIAELALESLLIGVLGIVLAVVFAIGLAICATQLPPLSDDPATRPWPLFWRRSARNVARGVLSMFRSVPEIIWAYLFVRIFGLGPGAAVFAIAITFSGIIGKLFAELIEAADPAPAHRLRASGAGNIAVFVFGVLPLVRRQWVGYALFRLECAIRSASILGVVGAGGLGSDIRLSIETFEYDKLASALIAVLAYVVLLEFAGMALRRAKPIWPIALFVVAAIIAIVRLPIPWQELTSAHAIKQAGRFVSGFFHPTLNADFVRHTLVLVSHTIAMAWLATAIAGIGAFVAAPLATSAFSIHGYLDDAPRGRGIARWFALVYIIAIRLVLQISRALPELVWALLFIVWVGPGITAGVLALTVHTFGILGRLYSDVLEEAEPAPPRTLEAIGANPSARYLYGVLPQVMPRLLAFTSFRFEVNLRAAAMVGFVGAGGLGDALDTAIKLFHMRDLASLLLFSIGMIIVIDYFGDRIRYRLLRS